MMLFIGTVLKTEVAVWSGISFIGTLGIPDVCSDLIAVSSILG
jgi:hypothetical protein